MCVQKFSTPGHPQGVRRIENALRTETVALLWGAAFVDQGMEMLGMGLSSVCRSTWQGLDFVTEVCLSNSVES